MKNKNLIIGTVVIVLVALIGLVFYVHKSAQIATTNNQAAVSAVVTGFGTKMQLVSILAPSSTIAQSMETSYGSYVSPDLLARWIADPTNAPGRTVSSPWPDHLAITSIISSSGVYTVKGSVIELTSNEVEHGGIADEYPITITVQRENGNWVITNWSVDSAS